MTFEKRQLAVADMGYSVSVMPILGEERVIAASEGTGPAVVFDGPAMIPRTVSEGPGGCMGFAGVPGRDDALFMITRFYPVFKAESAGVDLLVAGNGLDEPWAARRVLDLPFVHRIAAVSTIEGDYLVGSTVCGGKDFQDDWSRPGAVYACRIDGGLGGPWEPRVILDGIHRNHGLCVGRYRGIRQLLVSGDEGVVALAIPEGGDGTAPGLWSRTPVMDQPVSEVVLFDLDGDGEDELATIEPFHGSRLAVYKERRGSWEQVFSAELAFGHGLSAGLLAGERAAVVGNRAGTNDLVCFRARGSSSSFDMERIVVDAGSGSAGTVITATGHGDGIVASNAGYSEYALYIARREEEA